MDRSGSPLLDASSHSKSCFLKVSNLSRVFVFVFGISCGVIFSIMSYSALRQTRAAFIGWQPALYRPMELQDPALSDIDTANILKKTHSVEEIFHKGEDVIAEKLKEKVRILCIVLTTKDSYKTKAEAIKNTWGPRCNTLLFVSDFEDSDLPVVKLYAGSGRLEPWALLKSALKHVYIHLLPHHDWVLRVDDSTFVVVENLRRLLSTYSPARALYLGCRFKKFIDQGFMSGGAGYVLSREAVAMMVRYGLPRELCAAEDTGVEDVQMGYCMKALNVTLVDTRDPLGRGRFFPLSLEQHLVPGVLDKDHWYWDRAYYPYSTGLACCSDSAISFHDVGHQRMYVFNYLVYHLRPYGISHHPPVTETDIHIVIK